MDNPTWKCRDGKVVPIKDMEDSHLVNTLKMLKRKGLNKDSDFSAYMCGPPQGDMAYMAWEQEIADTTFRIKRNSSWDALKAEAKRRGIYAQVKS